MPRVDIPAHHFTKNVRKNYQNPDTALIREFLQNSVDAGATEIKFAFSDGVLVVEDDGCGMTKDVLVSALLTMSGSHKGENSIGGFGAAKEILLFQHASYYIETVNENEHTCVHGCHLDYEFIEDEDSPLVTKGTLIRIQFHEDYELEEYSFERSAKEYLESCNVKAKLTWNDDEIKCTLPKVKLTRELGWANVHSKEMDVMQSWAYVRVKGVTMFKVYVYNTKILAIVDILKPTTDIMTVNRDSFTHTYENKLQSLIQEIAIESGSFGKMYQKKKIWRGRNRTFHMEPPKKKKYYAKTDDGMVECKFDVGVLGKVIEKINEQKIEDEPEVVISKALSVAEDIMGIDFHGEMAQVVRRQIQEAVCDHYADFVIHVQGAGFDNIPKSLNPNSMSARYKQLAKLWKRAIKLVFEANNVYNGNISYNIGWVLDRDESTEASYLNSGNSHAFLLNPILPWVRKAAQKETFNRLILLACHEIAHIDHTYHNESFCNRVHDLTLNTLCFLGRKDMSWWKEYTDAKNEKL